jgi:filamentous hemagglutinin family protein
MAKQIHTLDPTNAAQAVLPAGAAGQMLVSKGGGADPAWSNAPTITGGSVDGAPVGSTTPAPGSFTTLTVSGTFSGGYQNNLQFAAGGSGGYNNLTFNGNNTDNARLGFVAGASSTNDPNLYFDVPSGGAYVFRAPGNISTAVAQFFATSIALNQPTTVTGTFSVTGAATLAAIAGTTLSLTGTANIKAVICTTVTASGTISGTTLTASSYVKSTGQVAATVTKTAAYTATSNDYTVRGNAASAAFTITLPASPTVGQILVFKKVDNSANVLTVDAGSGCTIDGNRTYPLNAYGNALWVQCAVASAGANVWDIL